MPSSVAAGAIPSIDRRRSRRKGGRRRRCRPRSPSGRRRGRPRRRGGRARCGRRSRCRHRCRRRPRGRKGTRPQLTDDGARLDAAILVLLPAPSSWSVRMCHGAPGHLAGAVADAAGGQVPVRDCARWPPHARSTADPLEVKLTTNSAVLLPPGRPGMVGAADGADRPAPDGQPSRDPRILLGAADRQTVRREPVGREGGGAVTRHRRAHRRHAAATRAAHRRRHPAV